MLIAAGNVRTLSEVTGRDASSLRRIGRREDAVRIEAQAKQVLRASALRMALA
jgi:hypothetical protein